MRTQKHCTLSHKKPSHRQWFGGTLRKGLDLTRLVSFTIRFRAIADHAWKWAAESSGGDRDGRVIFQCNGPTDYPLSYYVEGTNPNLHVDKIPSEAPQTQLWQLRGSVAAAKTIAEGDTSGWSHYVVGVPKDTIRWFSLVRLTKAWLGPRQGKGLPFAEQDAILYSCLRFDGLHLVFLAVSGLSNVTTVFQANQDKLVLEARNDETEEGTTRVMISVGKTPDLAIASVVYQIRKLMSSRGSSAHLDKHHDEDVGANWMQEWYDGLTYCTWNSLLGSNLTADNILGALNSLRDNGVNGTYLAR